MGNVRKLDTMFRAVFSTEESWRDLFAILHLQLEPDEQIRDMSLDIVSAVSKQNAICLATGINMLILFEMRDAFPVNVPLRMLLYTSKCLERYIADNGCNEYGNIPLQLPSIHLGVVYTGVESVKSTFTLSGLCFDGYSDIEVNVPVLTYGSVYSQSYLGQYFEYCKICDEVRLLTKNARERVSMIMQKCEKYDVLSRLVTAHTEEIFNIIAEQEMEKLYWVKHYNECKQRGLEQGLKQGRAEMQESVIAALMQRLGCSREQALQYITPVANSTAVHSGEKAGSKRVETMHLGD